MSGRFLRIKMLLTIFACFWGGLALTLTASEAGEVSTFIEEFDGQTLGSGWSIWDGYALNHPEEPANHATFGMTGSHLSISFPGGAEHNMWWLEHAQVSRLFEGSGVYEVKVDASLNGSQQFGLVFENTPGTFMIFMLYAHHTIWGYLERFANVDGVQYRTTLPGCCDGGYNTGLSVPDPGPYWLRVVVTDDAAPTNRHWTFEWSGDGAVWKTIIDGILEGVAPWSNIGTIHRVGVFAGNHPDNYSAFDARFDYYRTFPIAALPVQAPGDLAARAGDQQVFLAWDAVSGADEYAIYRSTTPGGPYMLLATTSDTSYTDSGLASGTTYAYVITAYNADQESAYSAEILVTLTGPPPVLTPPAGIPTAGLVLALDAANAALELTHGSEVTTWRDASGQGHDAVTWSGQAPTLLTGAVGGEAALRFDGHNDHLQLTGDLADFTAGLSLFVVARPTALQAGAKLVLLGNGAGQANVGFGRHGSSAALQYFTTNSGGSYAWFATDEALTVHEPALYTVVQGGGAADSQVAATVSKNGAVVGSHVVYVPPVVARTLNYLGKSYWASDGHFQGDLAELLLYNRALSPAEQAAVHAYLAEKYELSVPSHN